MKPEISDLTPQPIVQPLGAGAPTGSPTPIIDSRELLRGASSVLIRHRDECYRLQLTRAGKLILTK